MKAAVQQLIDKNTGMIAWTGSVFGWISFDLLRAAQIFAAMSAGAVSLCALILTAPQALAQLRRWRDTWRKNGQ